MEKEIRHTPTPWRQESGMIMARDVPIMHADREPGNGTEPVERDENIGFVLRACNNHDALVRDIWQLVEAIDDEGEHDHDPDECDVCYAVNEAKWLREQLDKEGETGASDLLLVAVELIEIAKEDAGLRAANEDINPALRAVYESYLGLYEKWLDKAKGKP